MLDKPEVEVLPRRPLRALVADAVEYLLDALLLGATHLADLVGEVTACDCSGELPLGAENREFAYHRACLRTGFPAPESRCAVSTMRLCIIGVPARCATHQCGSRLLAEEPPTACNAPFDRGGRFRSTAFSDRSFHVRQGFRRGQGGLRIRLGQRQQLGRVDQLGRPAFALRRRKGEEVEWKSSSPLL